MAKSRATRPLREWTEDCRARAHHQCVHLGSAGTVGLLGARRFMTICSCPCHWGCPAATVELSDMPAACTCHGNGTDRQQNFDALRRVFDRRT